MRTENALIVSLDIGTYKTSVIVAEATPAGLEVVGIGTAPSQGLHKGLIVNLDTTVRAIRKAVEEAEVSANCEIHTVCVGIAGGYVEGVTSQGIALVKDREVSGTDVAQAIEVARTLALPSDSEILHVVPQEFYVDGHARGHNPVGTSGVRLEANVHVVTVATSAVQAVVKCCERAGLQVSGMHLAALAAAEAVLTPEEKEMGVALVDLGGGVTSLAAYHRGVAQHTAVLRVGGYNITNDLAVGLRVPLAEAEKIKQRHGCARVDLLTPGEMIDMPRTGGRDPSLAPRRKLSEIIEPRAEEIFTLIKEELEAAGLLNKLGSGVVLTGGSAIMEGMTEVAERVFRLPVRRGAPRDVGGLIDAATGPMYATGVGLALCAVQSVQANGAARERNAHGWRRVPTRVAEWFRDFF